MSGTKNSISSLVAQFMRLQRNALEIINGLNEVATSTNDNVEIEMLDENGLPVSSTLPSYGYLRNQIKRLDSNIQSLAGLNNNFATVRNPDGTYAQIYKAQVIKEPQRLTNLIIPSTFSIKDNWFFESFLNPLLFVKIDVDDQINKDADRVLVKRIIANTQTDSEKNYFDSNIKGKNDLVHDSYIKDLENNGIGYFIDEEIVDLPLMILKDVGSFGVLAFYDDVTKTQDVNGNTINETRRNYRLNSLNYTDTSSGITDGKSLDIGDCLITEDGSKYEITLVNRSESSVQLKRLTGYQPISIGSDVLNISSTQFSKREIHINVGFDERQCIFFKIIDDNFNLIGSTFSTGIAFFSNELTINNQGKIQDLATFYKDQVSDMGQIFLGMAKEKKIPSIYGLVPEIPSLDLESLRVIQINKQLTESVSAKVLIESISAKEVLKKEIQTLDKSIEKTKMQLNKGHSVSTSINKKFQSKESINPKAVEVKLHTLTTERVQKQELYNSKVEEIAIKSVDTPQILEKPKYRIRGFFDIPNAKASDKTGSQEIIQFVKRYRYLSDSGASQASASLKYTGDNGQTKEGAYSNWIIEKSEIRQKTYDNDKGTYVWDKEDTENAENVNINQIDIPIKKGEQVELQVMSISEAGWPENPLKSDWSSSVIVKFPDDLSTTTMEYSILTNTEDKAVLKIKEELASIGMLDHLKDQSTNGNSTFVHSSNNISSGFYDSSGNPVNLFDKIQEITNEITNLRSLIDKAKGILEVYITDGEGEPIKVSHGDTLKLTAGFYNQIFTSPTNPNKDAGKIAAKVYNIQLINAAASLLELSSLIPGGQNMMVSDSIQNLPDYDNNLKYSKTPISITSLRNSDILDENGNPDNTAYKHASPFASGNSFSQFIYPRYKSVGYDMDLYVPQNNPYTSYSYDGIVIGNKTVPQNGESLIPYNPSNSSIANGGVDGGIWSGGYTGGTGGTGALGGGILTEFCIHKDHPALNSDSTPDFEDLVKPDYNDVLAYPAFRHSNYFQLDTSENGYHKQLEYQRVNMPFNSGVIASDRNDGMYPNKLGFQQDDEYLIGKYSCGSYLFLAPKSSSDIQVEGSTSLAKKNLQFGFENSINIPLVYQFRATDKLGHIGGFRNGGALSNITYTKRIGLDIKIKNENIFSFDIEITGRYKNDTLVSPNFFANHSKTSQVI